MDKLVQRGGVKKAFDIGDRRINKLERITQDQINIQLPVLYPMPLEVNEIELEIFPNRIINFTHEQIKSTIAKSSAFTSAGPSGLSNEYIQALVSNESFIDLLKVSFEQLVL